MKNENWWFLYLSTLSIDCIIYSSNRNVNETCLRAVYVMIIYNTLYINKKLNIIDIFSLYKTIGTHILIHIKFINVTRNEIFETYLNENETSYYHI